MVATDQNLMVATDQNLMVAAVVAVEIHVVTETVIYTIVKQRDLSGRVASSGQVGQPAPPIAEVVQRSTSGPVDAGSVTCGLERRAATTPIAARRLGDDVLEQAVLHMLDVRHQVGHGHAGGQHGGHVQP